MTDRVGTRGHEIDLYTLFTDADGNPIDADNIPQVTIYDSNGNSQITLQSGVSIADRPGLYKFSYLIPLYGPDGYYQDSWTAYIGGVQTTATFQFQVLGQGIISQAVAPVFEPTDDFTYTFTKYEAHGISILLALLKARVKNNGYTRTPNGLGGYTVVPCNVFTDDELIKFLIDSLSDFNSTPHFTQFCFSHEEIKHIFADIIVQGAELMAISAQAIIEKTKEFTITDNGVTYSPPFLSELLMNQYNAKLPVYQEKKKFIKASIKPKPLGQGTFRITSLSPSYIKLKSLRERQVF